MVVPIALDTRDVTGRWRLNRALSDSLEPTFALQGIPWIVRKVLTRASLELQYVQQAPSENMTETRFSVKQIVRPGNFDTINEYVIDGKQRNNKVPIFGDISVQCRRIMGEDTRHWNDNQGSQFILEEVVTSDSMGWQTTSAWFFKVLDGERRLCKQNKTKKNDQVVEATIVHDYVGPPEI